MVRLKQLISLSRCYIPPSSEGGVLITQISEDLASFEIWIFSYSIPTEQRSAPLEQALRKIKSTVTLNHKQLIDLLVVQIL